MLRVTLHSQYITVTARMRKKFIGIPSSNHVDREISNLTLPTVTPDVKQPPQVGFILFYFGILTLLIYIASPTGFFLDIVVSYMLKNQLHSTAADVSLFRFLIAIPVYIAFAFGFARDLWSPFGMRDRGYFLLFAALSACAFLLMAQFKLSATMLFVGLIALMIFTRFISGPIKG